MQTKAKHPVRLVTLVFLAVSAAACGGGEGPPGAGAPEASDTPAVSNDTGLTADELEYGIGPISGLDLGELDPTLAEAGAEIFAIKCGACHKWDERYVGPALRGVTGRRTPEFIMNMILNPDEMVEKHPDLQRLLAEYYTPMPNQQLAEEDARAVLEYLRQVDDADPVDDANPVGDADPGAQN